MTRLYLDRDSPLHRLHPTAKLLGMILFSLAVLLRDDPRYLAWLLGAALLLMAVGRAIAHLRRLWFILPTFLIVGLILWLILYPGTTPLVRLGGWTIHQEPVVRALAVACRTSIFFILGLTFLACIPVEEFSFALRSLGLPAPATVALTLAFRLMPLYLGSATMVLQAQKLRGLEPERGGLLERARRMVPLLVPTTLSALRGIDLMAMALESRGFGARRQRSEALAYPWRVADTAAVALPSLLILGLILSLWSR